MGTFIETFCTLTTGKIAKRASSLSSVQRAQPIPDRGKRSKHTKMLRKGLRLRSDALLIKEAQVSLGAGNYGKPKPEDCTQYCE